MTSLLSPAGHGVCASRQEESERVNDMLAQVGLNREHASRYAHEFSGGQRQRVGIARALIIHPELVICDEPISALDVSIQAQIVNMLRKFQQEQALTYLFIAHDLSMVRYVSDEVGVMYLGQLVETCAADEIYATPCTPTPRGFWRPSRSRTPKLPGKKGLRVWKGTCPAPLTRPAAAASTPAVPTPRSVARPRSHR